MDDVERRTLVAAQVFAAMVRPRAYDESEVRSMATTAFLLADVFCSVARDRERTRREALGVPR